MKDYADKNGERAFQEREQIKPELLTCEHTIKDLRRSQILTFDHYGWYQTSERTRKAARRLRPSGGPKSEPLPQQTPSSMPLVGEEEKLRARLKKHLRSVFGETRSRPEAQEYAKGSDLGERSAPGRGSRELA